MNLWCAGCAGVAFRANKVLQTRIAQENAIPTLVPLLVDTEHVAEETRVEVAYTLACIVLCHADNLQQLQSEKQFSFDVIRRLLCSKSEVCMSVADADDVERRTPGRSQFYSDKPVGDLAGALLRLVSQSGINNYFLDSAS